MRGGATEILAAHNTAYTPLIKVYMTLPDFDSISNFDCQRGRPRIDTRWHTVLPELEYYPLVARQLWSGGRIETVNTSLRASSINLATRTEGTDPYGFRIPRLGGEPVRLPRMQG